MDSEKLIFTRETKCLQMPKGNSLPPSILLSSLKILHPGPYQPWRLPMSRALRLKLFLHSMECPGHKLSLEGSASRRQALFDLEKPYRTQDTERFFWKFLLQHTRNTTRILRCSGPNRYKCIQHTSLCGNRPKKSTCTPTGRHSLCCFVWWHSHHYWFWILSQRQYSCHELSKFTDVTSTDGKTLTVIFTPERLREVVRVGNGKRVVSVSLYIVNEYGFSDSRKSFTIAI